MARKTYVYFKLVCLNKLGVFQLNFRPNLVFFVKYAWNQDTKIDIFRKYFFVQLYKYTNSLSFFALGLKKQNIYIFFNFLLSSSYRLLYK